MQPGMSPPALPPNVPPISAANAEHSAALAATAKPAEAQVFSDLEVAQGGGMSWGKKMDSNMITPLDYAYKLAHPLGTHSP
jgi:hypothetical protein